MAVTVLGERAKERKAKINDKGEREYRRVFVAKSTNKLLDGPRTIRTTNGIPQIGTTYAVSPTDTDSGARVVDIDPRPLDDGGYNWEVDVTYSSKFDDSAALNNPLSAPAEFSGSFARYSAPFVKDIISGFAVRNSAGEPFNPPVEVDDSRPVFTIKRNEGGYNLQRAIDYQDSVNSDVFLGIGAGLVKISNISFNRKFHNALEYYEITYEFECRREGWYVDILDIGLNEYIPPATTLTPIYDTNGVPQLLNGQGRRLTPGLAPVFLSYSAYKRRAFGPLGLP